MTIPSETERLIAHLKENRCVCPDCGYSLDGLQSPLCPECGRGLSVRLLTRKKSARVAYIMGGIGLLFSFVMHGTLLCVLLILTTAEAGFITSLVDALIGAVIFSGCLFMTLWWDDERDNLPQRSAARRWASAVVFLVSPIWTSLPWILIG